MASAERWIGSRQRWSGIRARPSQERQKRVVAASRASASSTSLRRGEAPRPRTARSTPSRPARARAGRGRGCPRCRARGRTASRIVCPAPVASAAWRPAVDERPLRRRAAVVEDRLADELDLDAAVDALDGADEHVVGVVVGGRAGVRRDRRRRGRAGPSSARRGRRPSPTASSRSSRARWCPARRRGRSGWLMPNGPKPEEAGLAVEQAAEDARRVEARARTASRSRRRARRARRCGSWTGTRSRRSAGTATARPRSARAARALLDGGHDVIHGSVPAAVAGDELVRGLRAPGPGRVRRAPAAGRRAAAA